MFSDNFSGTLQNGFRNNRITYEVSFTADRTLEGEYDLIDEYVVELIRDDGSRHANQSFDLYLSRGWDQGATIDGTVTWWTGRYDSNKFDSESLADKEKKDWMGISLAGKVDEILEMLSAEDRNFESPAYGSYYGACLLPDGSCFETSLDVCNHLGGRFQGPGTKCNPDDPFLRPRIMRSESTSTGLGKGFTIGIVAGIISGLVTTVFGTVLSEILLDRLREEPELEITEEDPGTNTPHI
jgi:hypothetical protein